LAEQQRNRNYKFQQISMKRAILLNLCGLILIWLFGAYAVEAAGRGDVRFVKGVLATGIHPDFFRFGTDTMMERAVLMRRTDVVSLLASKGADPAAAVRIASSEGSLDVLHALDRVIRQGELSGDTKERVIDIALMEASEHAYPDVVQYLISKGANVNFRDSISQSTPLIGACSYPEYDGLHSLRRVAVIKLLLTLGAIPNSKDTSWKSPLDYRVEAGDRDSIQVLSLYLDQRTRQKASGGR
jgi:ankyrin repeat protein